ncbi:MAG TPA: hypothetical protein VK213_00130 [Bacteroidales bacterium]|nr:hypothetical protein [Bacteroidales bacterium]
MKKCFFVLAFSCILVLSKGQAPEFDNFAKINLYPFGILTGDYSGTAFGGIHFSAVNVWKHTIVESSTLKFASWKQVYEDPYNPYNNQTTKDFEIIDGLTLDIGFNFVIRERLSIGLVPYSFVMSSGSSDGFAILGKYVFRNILIEGKIVPIAYFKGYDEGILNNNFYLGLSYYTRETFAWGLMHNRMGDFHSTNLGVTFQF